MKKGRRGMKDECIRGKEGIGIMHKYLMKSSLSLVSSSLYTS